MNRYRLRVNPTHGRCIWLVLARLQPAEKRGGVQDQDATIIGAAARGRLYFFMPPPPRVWRNALNNIMLLIFGIEVELVIRLHDRVWQP